MSGYTDLNLKDDEYRVPLPLEKFEQPVDFQDYNRYLMRVTMEISEASTMHLRYCLMKAKYVGQFKEDWNRAYAESAGLDLDRPIFEQRSSRSKTTIPENEARAAHVLGDRFKQMTMIDILIKAWDRRIEALQSQLTALQSASSNLRSEEQLSRSVGPKY